MTTIRPTGPPGWPTSRGAIVRIERRQGKGHVVRRMFADIDADCYILVDGDDTYDPMVAGRIADMVAADGYDFVNVARISTAAEAYRRGHRLGNRVLDPDGAVVFRSRDIRPCCRATRRCLVVS